MSGSRMRSSAAVELLPPKPNPLDRTRVGPIPEWIIRLTTSRSQCLWYFAYGKDVRNATKSATSSSSKVLVRPWRSSGLEVVRRCVSVEAVPSCK